MDRITSVKNPLVQTMRSLRDGKARAENKLFQVEGEVMIREALKCGLKLSFALADEKNEAFAAELEKEGYHAVLTTRAVLESVSETKTPQGICAAFGCPEPVPLDQLPDRIVVMDRVQDPGNVGTIWRTADAAGFQGLLLGGGTADPLSPKVQRAAMGSGFRLPYAYAENPADALKTLEERGYTVYAGDLRGEDFYNRRPCGKRFALVIGNEARGISEEVRGAANVLVKLPMRGGAESLNAAVAAGIMMYEMMREIDV